MLTAFIITLRGGLAAGLVIAVLMAYLHRIDRPRLKLHIYSGLVLALAAGLLTARGLGGVSRSIGEPLAGAAALAMAGMLTGVVFLMTGPGPRAENGPQARVTGLSGNGWGLVMATLVFLSLFPEAAQTLFSLHGLPAAESQQVWSGAALGLFAVVLPAWGLCRWNRRWSPARFFRRAGCLLLLLAAGKVSTGTLALESAGWLPATIAAWNSEGLVGRHSLPGSLLNGLVGYTGQPSVLQVIFCVAYLALVSYMFFGTFKNIAARKETASGEPVSEETNRSGVPAGGTQYGSRLYRFLRHPLFPRLTQVVMGLLFVFLIVAAIVPLKIGPFNNHGPLQWGPFHTAEDQNNLFNFVLWVAWLPLVSLTAVFFSRFWCGNLCPLRLVADASRSIADRLFGRPRSTSPYLRIGWILPLNFILITLLVKVPDIQPHASTSAYLFIGIFIVAVLVSMFLRRGSWCRYICPIGGWLARIARMGVLAVRARRDICTQCQDKPCLNGNGAAGRCPAFLNPTAVESSRYCLECWKCVKNCPADKASLHVSIRFPGAELQRPHAPEPGEAVFIGGLMGLYVAAAQRGHILPQYNFGLVLIGLTLAGMAAYLVLSTLIAWLGKISWKESVNKLGYALLPLELATALVAFGDDAMGFLGITVPASAILLGLGFTGSLLLSASILRHNIPPRRWGFAFSTMAAVLILVLTMWLKWYVGGHPADMT